MSADAVFRQAVGYEEAVIVSLTVAHGSALFTEARCVCGHRVMMIPGVALVGVYAVSSNADSSGRGRVVECRKCHTFCEVIEYGSAR